MANSSSFWTCNKGKEAANRVDHNQIVANCRQLVPSGDRNKDGTVMNTL